MKINSFIRYFEQLIFFAIAFPFLPPIFRTDTQPFFSIVVGTFFFLILLFKIPLKTTFKFTKFATIITLLFILNLLFSTFINNSFSNQGSLQRFLSFSQFIIAFFIGSSLILKFDHKIFYKFIWVYLLFTIIFFITGGFVEKLLLSRTSDFLLLTISGRGASTLSPEPSFYALSVWNIFIINSMLIRDNYNSKKDFLFIVLSLICILSTMGGYAVVYFLVISSLYLFDLVRKSTFLLLILLGTFFYIIYNYSSRAIKLVTSILETGINISTADASISSRLISFSIYWKNFIENLLTGNGFEYFGGGGFISIFSGLGILTTSIILFIVIKYLFTKNSLRLKLIILTWVSVNLISGPMGIPAIGFILGYLTRKNQDK